MRIRYLRMAHNTPALVSPIHCRNSEMRARSSHSAAPSPGRLRAITSTKAVSSAISTTISTTGAEQKSGRKNSSTAGLLDSPFVMGISVGGSATAGKSARAPRARAARDRSVPEQAALEAEQGGNVLVPVPVLLQAPVMQARHFHHRQLLAKDQGVTA